jgi:hypothetical protein
MSFSKTYAETAFVGLTGGNKPNKPSLLSSVLAQPSITDAIEGIRVSEFGLFADSPEGAATGRVWMFVFTGAGPNLAGGGQAALDAIVAAHTGVYTPPASPATGGSAGQFWSNVDGTSYAWATPPGAGGGEANTTSNSGATGTGIALAKVGTDLPFAKIDGVNGITESLVSNVLQIDGAALLPLDGSRSMAAGLNMGGFAITNVGNVDGRDVSADATTWGNHIASTSLHVPALGTNGQVLTVNSGSGIAEWQTPAVGANDVTAAAVFSNDNRLLRSDGTSRGAQASGITVDDSNNMSGMGTLASGAITVGSGDVTLTTGNIVLSQAGATVDGVDLTAQASALSTHTGNATIHVPALGSTGQVLTVSTGGAATEWATPAASNTTNYVRTSTFGYGSAESDVTGWTGIALVADKIYKFTMVLQFSNVGASSPGLGVGLFFTNSPNNFGGFAYSMISSSTDNDKQMVEDTVATSTTVSSAGTIYTLFAVGTFRANSGTPGTVKVRVAGGGASGGTIHIGSVFTLEKLN